MRMLIDSIRFQNKNHHGGEDPIIAEIELVVDDLPDFDMGGNEISAENFPPAGSYYVTLYVENRPANIDEEWQKHYIVSKGGIYDYCYNGKSVEDDPEIIEKYDRIVDAEESAFIDYFLLLEEYLTCSRENHLSNVARTAEFQREKAECSVSVEAADKYKIVSRYRLDSETAITFTVVPGYSIKTENGNYMFPKRNFAICRANKFGDDETVAEFPYIENTQDKSLFRILCGLERFTEEQTEDFFNNNLYVRSIPEKEKCLMKKNIIEAGFGKS